MFYKDCRKLYQNVAVHPGPSAPLQRMKMTCNLLHEHERRQEKRNYGLFPILRWSISKMKFKLPIRENSQGKLAKLSPIRAGALLKIGYFFQPPLSGDDELLKLSCSCAISMDRI